MLLLILDTGFLTVTTRDKFLPVLKNNLYNQTRLLKVMDAKGRVQDMTGTSLTWDVVAKRHQAVGRFSGYSVIPNAPINPVTQATLPNGNYVATISISKEEEKKNAASPERLVNMLETQMKNAEATLRELLSTDFYSDGTAVGGIYGIIGLQAVVATANTYANINRSTSGNSYWQATANASAYTDANLEDPTQAGYLPRVMNNLFTGCSYDGSPDIIVTTKKIYNIYKIIAQTTNLRFTNEKANLGFSGVEFDAGVTMIFDDYCTSKYMYMLNTADWSVFVYPGANFDFDLTDGGSMWKQPTDQLAKLAHIIWMGQWRCDAPRQQAVATGLGS